MNLDDEASDLPPELAKPARRALAAAGHERLEHVATVGEAELLRLHGIGPKALGQLRRALAAHGLAFSDAARRTGESAGEPDAPPIDRDPLDRFGSPS